MEPVGFYFEENWSQYFEIIIKMFLIAVEAQCVKVRYLNNNTYIYEELRTDENKKNKWAARKVIGP